MNTKIYARAALAISAAGVLFSGYLSGIKFFSNTCAFSESCPYFLGYPACYFGFALFLALFIASLLLVLGKAGVERVLRWNTVFATAGVAFSGYFAYPEVKGLIAGTLESTFWGLSTCIYGLFFFALMLIMTVWAKLGRGRI